MSIASPLPCWLVVLHLTNKITSEQLLTAIGVLTTAGLLAAKDHSKTGE